MRVKSTLLLICALLLAVLGSGCAVKQAIEPATMATDLDHLREDLEMLPPMPTPLPASGSLWSDGGPGASMARDTRAYRLNDLLTVVLFENASGRNQSETGLSRTSDSDFGAGVAFGLESASPTTGNFNINNVLSSSSSSEFAGEGETSRSNLLTGNLTTRVMRVLPNGDLVIGGQKTVMVNRERQIMTLVGSVRPVDINSANRIASASVGDLTVRLWGRGEVDANVRQGWFMRVMNRIWPF